MVWKSKEPLKLKGPIIRAVDLLGRVALAEAAFRPALAPFPAGFVAASSAAFGAAFSAAAAFSAFLAAFAAAAFLPEDFFLGVWRVESAAWEEEAGS